MRPFLLLVIASLALLGCKGFKEQQHQAFVGDSQTKVYYKNVGGAIESVPKERRVYFRSVEEAMDQGYQAANDASSGENAPAEE